MLAVAFLPSIEAGISDEGRSIDDIELNHEKTLRVIPVFVIGCIRELEKVGNDVSFFAILLFRSSSDKYYGPRGLAIGEMVINGFSGIATKRFICGTYAIYPGGW